MPTYNYSGDYYIRLLKDLYRKNGVTIPEADFSTLQRLVDEERARDEAVRSWQRVKDNKIGAGHLDLPFTPIYSQVLTEDVASLTIPIPGGYKHILIMGHGRSSAANGGVVFVRFNGDTASNYRDSYILGNESSVSSGGSDDTQFPVGIFANSGDPTGRAGIFESHIPHYTSKFHKMSMNQAYYNDDVTRTVYIFNSLWKNTDPITSMEIYVTDNTSVKGTSNMVSGSVLSVYLIQ